jgi:hypothetical protein
VSNDAEYLYVSLITVTKEAQAQILRQGLIVWFNAGSKQDKVLGIYYPLGILGYGDEVGDMVRLDRLNEMDRHQRMELMAERFEGCLDELEILTQPDPPGLRMYTHDTPGIETVVVNSASRLAYELKIPLQESPAHPYAVGKEKADQVTLGFQTLELDLEALREQMIARADKVGSPSDRRSSGTMPGGGMGGMPGGMPSSMGHGRSIPPEPIVTWLKVKLKTSR